MYEKKKKKKLQTKTTLEVRDAVDGRSGEAKSFF